MNKELFQDNWAARVEGPGSMKCQFCTNPATVHLTSIFNKSKRDVHLCEECAREHHLNTDSPQEINIHALLEFITGQISVTVADSKGGDLCCPHCGIKYAQFRALGRLGCPCDYEVFRETLEPLLERIHRSTSHAGKAPERHRARRKKARRQALLDELQGAVREERFEDAARLRDQIRSMGTADESR